MTHRNVLPLALLLAASQAVAQVQPAQRQQGTPRPQRREVVMDTARARSLYVSNKAEDQPQADFTRQIAAKAATDSTLLARSKGAYDFQKITYKSSADGMEVPAYLFTPL